MGRLLQADFVSTERTSSPLPRLSFGHSPPMFGTGLVPASRSRRCRFEEPASLVRRRRTWCSGGKPPESTAPECSAFRDCDAALVVARYLWTKPKLTLAPVCELRAPRGVAVLAALRLQRLRRRSPWRSRACVRASASSSKITPLNCRTAVVCARRRLLGLRCRTVVGEALERTLFGRGEGGASRGGRGRRRPGSSADAVAARVGVLGQRGAAPKLRQATDGATRSAAEQRAPGQQAQRPINRATGRVPSSGRSCNRT